MGQDKALLPWGGATLLDLAIARLRECCREVVILCGPDPRYEDRGIPIAVDQARGAGPLGAVMTGLSRIDHRPAVFLAVDLPNVPAALLAHLVTLVPGYDAAVPVLPRGPEPLCAVYTAACLGPIQDRIAAGDLKMTSFWPRIRRREVLAEELAGFGGLGHVFRNINTADDLAVGRSGGDA
jgi:molybdopterin-guanine dinucleotide biosynthesis protein A